jgi:hypothetical protein
MLWLALQLGRVGGPEPFGVPKAIILLRASTPRSHRATFALISDASVARCRVDADVCNAMIG